MFDSLNLLSGKRKYLFGLMILLSFISVICAAFSMTGSDDFDIARREVLLRRIGHEQLLQSGDSTSRVLLIKKIDENEYQIRFENDLTFQPDSPLWQHAALGKSAKAYSYLFKTVPRALCFGNQIAMKYYALVKINAVG